MKKSENKISAILAQQALADVVSVDCWAANWLASRRHISTMDAEYICKASAINQSWLGKHIKVTKGKFRKLTGMVESAHLDANSHRVVLTVLEDWALEDQKNRSVKHFVITDDQVKEIE